ncbi:hypothetical protein D3C85_1874840 [compost metagenome]
MNGTQKTKACKQHLASPSQFSANLKVMQEAAQAALDLFAEDFYRTRLSVQADGAEAAI